MSFEYFSLPILSRGLQFIVSEISVYGQPAPTQKLHDRQHGEAKPPLFMLRKQSTGKYAEKKGPETSVGLQHYTPMIHLVIPRSVLYCFIHPSSQPN